MAYLPLLLCSALIFDRAAAVLTTHDKRSQKYWSSWEDINYFFTFGDSYTTTDFNVTGTQPNPSNPLGNPDYPGYTSSNGPNWVDFLTTTYNKSYVQTYNFAYGGATVDSSLVAQYLPTVLDLEQQVDDEFLVYYTNSTSVNWTASNSLFSIFIGINDVGNSYSSQNSTLNGLIFEAYSHLVDELYEAGARNFLFLNVPPVDRSPLTIAQGTSAQTIEAADIADFNAKITNLTSSLEKTHLDATVFLFNTHEIFTQVLDDPTSYPQTELYKNTTDYCTAYEDGTDEWDSYDAACGIPVNEYFWLNNLHPTYPMHNATAAQIIELLEG
ncbi:MAG: hypothetical protein M1834_001271 [Cirrosporium novae-zelandiae]|nr:MAG: hypothetical protein M1834_001271 [Cirrosporium novae-zelandiae]